MRDVQMDNKIKGLNYTQSGGPKDFHETIILPNLMSAVFEEYNL